MIIKALLELNAYVSMLKYYRKKCNSEIYHDVCINDEPFCYGTYLVECWEQIVKILDKATKGSASDLYDHDFLLNAAMHYFKRSSDPITSKEVVKDFLESVDNVRRCSICGRLMQEGYCQDGGYRYYCSDNCLHHDFTDEEWNKECENNDQSYWTQWY